MSNFFYPPDAIGLPRGEAAFPFLSELNPAVKCNFETRKLEYLLENEKNYFKKFQFIIISRLDLDLSKIIRNHCFNLDIPLLQVRRGSCYSGYVYKWGHITLHYVG